MCTPAWLDGDEDKSPFGPDGIWVHSSEEDLLGADYPMRGALGEPDWRRDLWYVIRSMVTAERVAAAAAMQAAAAHDAHAAASAAQLVELREEIAAWPPPLPLSVGE